MGAPKQVAWRFTPGTQHESPMISVLAADGTPRCNAQFSRSTTERITDELNGYARLAAAAPDLLDALRLFFSVSLQRGDCLYHIDEAAWLDARRAIAKALDCEFDAFGKPVDDDEIVDGSEEPDPERNPWGQPSLLNDRLWGLACDLRVAADSVQALGADDDSPLQRAHRARDIVKNACPDKSLANLLDAARRDSANGGGAQ